MRIAPKSILDFICLNSHSSFSALAPCPLSTQSCFLPILAADPFIEQLDLLVVPDRTARKGSQRGAPHPLDLGVMLDHCHQLPGEDVAVVAFRVRICFEA